MTYGEMMMKIKYRIHGEEREEAVEDTDRKKRTHSMTLQSSKIS